MFGNLTGVTHTVSSAPVVTKTSFGSLTRHEAKYQTIPFEVPKNEEVEEVQTEEELQELQKATRSWVEQ